MRYLSLGLAFAAFAITAPAFADCAADLTSARAAVATTTDQAKAKELQTLVDRADMELNAEHDERECRDIMRDAKKLMN